MSMPIRTTARAFAQLSCVVALGLATPVFATAAPKAQNTGQAKWVVVRDPQADLVPVPPLPPARVTELAHRRPYQFRDDKDWFSRNLETWTALLAPYMGKPNLSYLEIGVYEGRSMLWVVDHVLTDESSRATGIDIGISDALKHNVEISGAASRITLVQARSQAAMRSMSDQRFDLIYIDGAHTADAVLEDVVLAWGLLKPGGLMILDDYGFRGREGKVKNLPMELRPGIAIHGFVSAYRDYVQVAFSGYQLALEKREGVCTRGKRHCSMLGPYAYYWDKRTLFRNDEKVPLGPKEREVVEALIRGKLGDALRIRIDRALFDSPAFKSLDSRLGLGLRGA